MKFFLTCLIAAFTFSSAPAFGLSSAAELEKMLGVKLTPAQRQKATEIFARPDFFVGMIAAFVDNELTEKQRDEIIGRQIRAMEKNFKVKFTKAQRERMLTRMKKPPQPGFEELLEVAELTPEQQKKLEQTMAPPVRCVADASPPAVDPTLASLAQQLTDKLAECEPRSAKDRREDIDALAEVIQRDLLKVDPEQVKLLSSFPDSPFNGSLDWHSAVHGHWALLTMARLTGDDDRRKFVTKRLTEEVLERERQYLRDNPRFERPYGRAWLLLLLRELERVPETDKEFLANFRREVFEDVLGYLEKIVPKSAEQVPENEFAHDGFFINAFLASLASPTGSPERARLEGLLQRVPAAFRENIQFVKTKPFDFVFPPALLASLDRLGEKKVPPYRPRHAPIGSMRQVPATKLQKQQRPPIKDDHWAGLLAISAWPYALESARGDALACNYYRARTEQFFAEKNEWTDDFGVSHWVPQMIWMGMWLEMGRGNRLHH